MKDSIKSLNDSSSYLIKTITNKDTIYLSREYIDNHYLKMEKSEISSDTIFTVFVTLSVFIIGIVIDRSLKWLDKRSKKKKLRSYFKYHLNKVNEGLVLKLRDGYQKYYFITDVNSGLTSTPPKVLSSDFERLLHIDNSELFHAFTDKKVLSRTLSQIDFVYKIQKEVDNFHSLALKESTRLRGEIKVLSDEYISLLAEYVELKKDKHDETIILFDNSVVHYYRELAGKRKLSEFYKKIIRPIQNHLTFTELYKNDLDVRKIAEKGRKISHVYNELRYRSVEVRLQYRVFSKYMSETSSILSDLKSLLK